MRLVSKPGISCRYSKDGRKIPVLQKKLFLRNFKASPLEQITLQTNELSLTVLDYGAIIRELLVKDRYEKPTNVVVGLPEPEAYLQDTVCLGACVGRYAGRISGSFQLEGKAYPLHTVARDVHLHGGKEGFYKKFWKIERVSRGSRPFVTLSYLSPHMEEGYPGTLKVLVTYTLIGNSLQIAHEATTDRTTVVNLVNHSYFRLDDETGVGHYRMQLQCPEYLETRENLLPTGNILPVADSPYDFLKARPIGDIHLDTPYVIAPNGREVASLYSHISGLRMDVETNQPGLVVYTPRHFTGICFETQNFPDAPNMPHFPSSVLRPGMTYNNTSRFNFECMD